ncbi:MAG: hypothetical protein U1E52_18180 [Geminicoccaceae bacterium]
MRHPDAGLTRRVVLRSAGVLIGGLTLRPAAGGEHRRDIVLLAGRAPLGSAGFRFANYQGAYPFWSPSWAEVLAGRPLGRDAALPERDTLATTLAAAGFDVVLAADNAQFASDGSVPALEISIPPAGAGGPLVVVSAGPGCSDVAMNPLDIAPTICGLTGVRPSPAFVGRDYAALVARPRAADVHRGAG